MSSSHLSTSTTYTSLHGPSQVSLHGGESLLHSHPFVVQVRCHTLRSPSLRPSYRAAIVNAQVDAGKNVLVTGVGGGVALVAVQLCVAKGANVYVTSGSWEKVHGAVALGARGGVLYKDGACVRRDLI